MATSNSNISPEAVTARERNRATGGQFGFKDQSDPEANLPGMATAAETRRNARLTAGLKAMGATVIEHHPTATRIMVCLPYDPGSPMLLDTVYDTDGAELSRDSLAVANAVQRHLVGFEDSDEARAFGFRDTDIDGFGEYLLYDLP